MVIILLGRLMGRGARASARDEAVPVRQAHGFARDRFKDAPCGKQCICTSITPLRRRQPRLQTFLEDVYNAKRLHSSLDYVPPDEFELKDAMC